MKDLTNARFFRNCPYCNDVIGYRFNCHYKPALDKNLTCGKKECESKRRSLNMQGERNPMFGRFKELNLFFGKKHSPESKQLMSAAQLKNIHIYQTDEFRAKISEKTSKQNNGMFGKTFFEQWVKKYGEEIAVQKLSELRKKHSNNNTGCKNPMFGKPSPIGSGIGISGWWNGHYFRSILELTYLVKIINRFNLTWVSAEKSQFKIKYIDNFGISKNHFADFIINEKYMIECKPKSLQNLEINIIKRNAAEQYCLENNLKYKTFSTSFITKKEFIDLVSNNKIILTKKWKLRYENNTLNF